MTDSAFVSMNNYINAHTHEGDVFREALFAAHTDARENILTTPGVAVGSLLSTLAASGSASDSPQGAVLVTPVAGVVGLHVLNGLPDKATVTCIDPEAEHQARAKEYFHAGGFASARARFLTAHPLEVMSRLAPSSYHLVYADVDPVELPALISAAWPLLTPGGTLAIAGSLLDGTVADTTRRDKHTEAARAADADVDKLAADESAVVTRLPLDGGLTLVTKK